MFTPEEVADHLTGKAELEYLFNKRAVRLPSPPNHPRSWLTTASIHIPFIGGLVVNDNARWSVPPLFLLLRPKVAYTTIDVDEYARLLPKKELAINYTVWMV